MTPKQFTALAIAAALCLAAAVFSYASSVTWSSGTAQGAALFASMRTDPPPDIARVEIEQGDKKLALTRKGNDWVLLDGFPAMRERVRALLLGIAEADLVEPKTRQPERYALLGLEDPKRPDAASRLVRLYDAKQHKVAELIVGKRRANAFGTNRTGTYVRLPGEAQTWLADTAMEGGVGLRDWIDTLLVVSARPQVNSISLRAPGKDPIDIARGESGDLMVKDLPAGMKLKYTNSLDDIAEAVANYSFDDVRKAQPAADDKVSIAVLKLASGAEVTVRMRQDGEFAWASFAAKGDSAEAKSQADALQARVEGWEFRVPESKMSAIFRSREDLLEKIGS